MNTKNKSEDQLPEVVQRVFLKHNARYIALAVNWVTAIEKYLEKHAPEPGCPDTDWKKSIPVNLVRRELRVLYGSRIGYDLARLLEMTLEERGLKNVQVETERILFQ